MSNDRTSHVHPKQLAHRPPPSPLRGSKKGVKGFLRGPSWTKRSCRCRSSRPFAVLRGQKEVAVAVLRGPSWPFVALRGQKEVAVAVLRGPSWPFVDKKKLPLPFFVALSGPSWTKRSCVAVLRGPSRTKRSCRCRSSRSFAALRGQKEVAVAVLRGPSRPFVDKKKLPLPFFVVLRGPQRPFVDKKKLPLPFFAPLRGPSWTKRSCRCRSSRPFAALRGQKEVAVAVIRAPSWKNHQSTLNNPNFSHRTPAPQKTLPQPRI